VQRELSDRERWEWLGKRLGAEAFIMVVAILFVPFIAWMLTSRLSGRAAPIVAAILSGLICGFIGWRSGNSVLESETVGIIIATLGGLLSAWIGAKGRGTESFVIGAGGPSGSIVSYDSGGSGGSSGGGGSSDSGGGGSFGGGGASGSW
jgi:hypothetical protein